MKYETAKYATEYIWDTFYNPNESKKEEVFELLEGYINRKLDENGTVNLFFLSTGNISLFVKFCAQEALSGYARSFDLVITKEKVIDNYVSRSEPVFEVGKTK